MKSAGFYRQLLHGNAQGPDLGEAVAHPIPEAERDVLSRYLRECPVLAATSRSADDVLDPTKTKVSRINIHTDGEWEWPEDLAYYVETYGARLPPGLAKRAQELRPPEFTDEQLALISDRSLDDPAHFE